MKFLCLFGVLNIFPQDYFVCDDDVVWEGDYEDFIHTNAEGKRVLDHSRIDDLKSMKVRLQ